MKIVTTNGDIYFDPSDVKQWRTHTRLKDTQLAEVLLDLRSKGTRPRGNACR
jgi:hypothetical protein